nr:PEP-CTERM sorting domain-containing protein [uncultured Roseateles sp.]
MKLHALFTAALAASSALAFAPAQAAVVIDDFNTPQTFFSCDFPGLSYKAGDMLYGDRLFSGGCSKPAAGGAITVAGGLASYGAGGISQITINALYDASLPPGSGDPVQAADLTQAGANDRFAMRIRVSNDTRFTLSVTSASESASLQLDLPATAGFVDLALPFASFSPASAALWQGVTRVSFQIVDTTVNPGGSFSASGDIDFIRAVPEPGSAVLLGLGLLGLALRRQSAASSLFQ